MLSRRNGAGGTEMRWRCSQEVMEQVVLKWWEVLSRGNAAGSTEMRVRCCQEVMEQVVLK